MILYGIYIKGDEIKFDEIPIMEVDNFLNTDTGRPVKMYKATTDKWPNFCEYIDERSFNVFIQSQEFEDYQPVQRLFGLDKNALCDRLVNYLHAEVVRYNTMISKINKYKEGV
jgi:hypothetical protein